MKTLTPICESRPALSDAPQFLYHPSFAEPQSLALYGPASDSVLIYQGEHMPDEVTRETSRRMHYAAYRVQNADDADEAADWKARYYQLRDQVVMGNRKLVFQAVHRWNSLAQRSDDLIGECYIVLIRVVAVYNPWLGIRFSTYAYTCLIRALSRQSRRWAGEWLAQCLPLDNLADGEPQETDLEETPSERLKRLDEYLHQDHPLLSLREKEILTRRFCLHDDGEPQTLEKVGEELGLSKERVRQVQATALGKLRRALGSDTAFDIEPMRRHTA